MNARRLAAVVLLVASSVSLAVLCWRGVYVRYKADDFWTASIVARLGFWKSQSFWYQRWSGRFAYTFLIGLVESFGPRLVPALVTITIVSWVAAMFALLKRLQCAHSAALATALVYSAAEGTIDVPQSILWQTGLLTYVVPIVGLTAWLATTVDRERVRWYDAVVPFVLAGFSETNTLCQIIALTALALAIPRRRRIFKTALIGSLCAFIVVALSPGNAVRMSLYPRHSAIWIAKTTVVDTAIFFADEAGRSGAALLLIFVAAMLLAPRVTKHAAATAAGVALCSALFTYLAAITTLSLAPPTRTLIVPHFFLVVALASIGAAVPHPKRLERFAVPLLVLLSAGGPVVSAVMRARSIPEAAAFARGWDRLDAELRRNRDREVTVAGAPGSAGTLLFITHNPDMWSNRCISDYYSLRGIASSPRGPSGFSKLLEDLPVYAVEGPRRHDQHNVVRLRFATD